MITDPKFTPEVLVSAPRRGPAIPNQDGTLALFTVSTHNIGGRTSKEICLMNVESGGCVQMVENADAHDAVWAMDGSNTVFYLQDAEGGMTRVMAANADRPFDESFIVDEIPAPVRGLKVQTLPDGSVAFVVVGYSSADGSLYNPHLDKKHHSARVYNDYKVRAWNAHTEAYKHSLWYTVLVKQDERWHILLPLQNTVKDRRIEAPLDIHQPLSATDNFDVSAKGIVFAAADPTTDDPLSHVTRLYYLPVESFSRPSVQPLVRIGTGVEEERCSRPRFSPDGGMVAFLRSPSNRRLEVSLCISHLGSQPAVNVFELVTGKKWDLIPNGFEFAPNGHFVYLTADDCGRTGLYRLDLQPNAYPQTLMRNGSVSSYYPLGIDNNDEVLVSSSSFVESSLYQVIDSKGDLLLRVVSSATKNGAKIGLSQKQISEIYFEGSGDYVVHAWVVKPRNFDPSSQKYPLAMLIHGGPSGAWNDQWNTTFNPAVWAEQGYIVVLPNITGSTGFGLSFAEAVQDSWGGRPYDDLINCFDYMKTMPGIDTDNAVAAGAGFGGYMVNWIQGNDMGRRFKALVSHAGIFNLPSLCLQTDEPGDDLDFGGQPYLWQNPEGMERYNPARADLLRNWETPMLIIQNDKDYRCPVTEGIAAYHTLKAQGTPARFVNFADEGQLVLKEENSLEWHRQVFTWINKFSGVAGEPEESLYD